MQEQMNRMKRTIIKASASAGDGHIPSALSVLDILWVLYDRVLQVDPQNPRSDGRAFGDTLSV